MKKYLLFAAYILCYIPLYASTTSNSVVRNIQVNDGFVDMSNTLQANSTLGQWEIDEQLDSDSSAIKWLLSWDDTHLYIGKVGGKNSDASILSIHADYATANFSNLGKNYSQFNPNFNQLGGINFQAYVSDSTTEFQFYDTAWSAAHNSIQAAFASSNNVDQLELSIAWDSITNGHGKPSNFRIVFHQFSTDTILCSSNSELPFLYATSPYGDGLAGNGPSISVNDGVSISNLQPTACNHATDTIQRWWGCFPSLGGISPNNFIAALPQAGSDIHICASADTIQLNGNPSNTEAEGTWSISEMPFNATPNFSDIHFHQSLLSGLNTPGDYTLIWKFDYGTCYANADTLLIHVIPNLAPVSIGNDLAICITQDSTALNATPIDSTAIGTWSVLSSPNLSNAIISNIHTYQTSVSGLNIAGDYLLRFEATNGVCPVVADTLLIQVAPLITSTFAGNDQELCVSENSTTLSGSLPPANAQGSWSIASFPTGALPVITDIHQAQTTFTGFNVVGNYLLLWTISNGLCNDETNTLEIHVSPAISSVEAGNDITLCSSTDSVQINAISSVINGIGTWSIAATPNNASISITDVHAANTLVHGLTISGEYKLVYTIADGPCSANDTLRIFVWQAIPTTFAGTDQLLSCGITSGSLSADAIAPESNYQGGLGYWTSLSNSIILSDSTSAQSAFSNIPFGKSTFVWHAYNSGCSEKTDTVQVACFAPVTAQSTDTLRTCSNFIQLSGNDPAQFQNTAQGTWSIVSGPSGYNFNNINSNITFLYNLSPVNYVAKWKISNGNCASDSSETFVIAFPVIQAGNDTTIQVCNYSDININAIDPQSIHPSVSGSWSLLSNQSSSFNLHNSNLYIDSLSAGDYILQWKLSNGYCSADSALYTLHNYAQPIANAGIDTLLCSALSFQLYANNPVNIQATATGNWSVISGTGNASNASSYQSTISNFNAGTLWMKWTVSNGVCASAADTIELQIVPLIDAQVSGNINVCDSNSIQLNAVAVNGASSAWQLISGGILTQFSDVTNPQSTLLNLDYETTRVRWKVVGYCNVDSADVVINNFRKPISLAGSERFICEDTLTLLANNPLSIASTASGEWLRIDGDATAQISNPSSYNSAITSLLRGDYTLQWTVSNGVCAPAVSNTIIHVNEPFSFGVITTKRGDHEKETGSITVSKPFYAFSPIRLSIDDQAFFSDTLFDSLSVGKHELHLIDFAGCRVDTIIEIRPNLFIPNGISPNGDQANDTWQLLGIDAYSGAVVRLFNLWGQKIFESVSNQDIFDGTFQGEQLPDGDYYYIIDLNDGSEVLKGKLTMIR